MAENWRKCCKFLWKVYFTIAAGLMTSQHQYHTEKINEFFLICLHIQCKLHVLKFSGCFGPLTLNKDNSSELSIHSMCTENAIFYYIPFSHLRILKECSTYLSWLWLVPSTGHSSPDNFSVLWAFHAVCKQLLKAAAFLELFCLSVNTNPVLNSQKHWWGWAVMVNKSDWQRVRGEGKLKLFH